MYRYILLLLAASLTPLQAQLDPLSQTFNRLFIPDLVSYDSISLSPDTGAAFNVSQTAKQDYFSNGQIDTLVVATYGVPQLAYQGQWNGGNHTVLKGVDVGQGANDSLERYDFYTSQNGRDSAMHYASYLNGSFQEQFYVVYGYNANARINQINIMVQGFGVVGQWQLYYITAGLDSIYYSVSTGMGGPGFLLYQRDSLQVNKITAIDTYEDPDNDGEWDLQGREIPYYTNGAVDVVESYGYDNFSGNFQLEGVLHFDVHSRSAIGLGQMATAHWSVYPNPSAGLVRLKGVPQQSLVEVYDLKGTRLHHEYYRGSLDLGHLPRGIYHLKWEGESRRWFKW